MAIMAATLATGGRCPMTHESIITKDIVKNCLQLLLSCGMYDYSGEWACTIGLPAKSGVSGSIFVVIPNVMGLAIWSPRLDSRGNSYRGVQFCTQMTEQFSLSLFDQIFGGGNVDRINSIHRNFLRMILRYILLFVFQFGINWTLHWLEALCLLLLRKISLPISTLMFHRKLD
jgi:hypothetical protein